MSVRRVFVIAGVPLTLAALAGGSAAFASSLGGDSQPGTRFERHSQSDTKDDSSDCPFGHGGDADEGASTSGLADQT